MEDKIKQLKETHLKITQLMEELEEAYKIETIKKDFPETKLFSFNHYEGAKKYEVKFLKLTKDVELTLFLADVLFNEFMYKDKSQQFIMIKINRGRITEYEKQQLKKLKILSVKEIGVN